MRWRYETGGLGHSGVSDHHDGFADFKGNKHVMNTFQMLGTLKARRFFSELRSLPNSKEIYSTLVDFINIDDVASDVTLKPNMIRVHAAGHNLCVLAASKIVHKILP